MLIPRPLSAPFALAVAASSLFLAACGRGEEGPYLGTIDRLGRPGSTLHVNNGADPAYLDPGLSRDDTSNTILLHLFEGLTAYHPVDLHPTQGTAERWDVSADGRVYRFHLRADARWSDGRPVVAGDFVYAWRRALRPSTASQAATMLYVLRNAEGFNLGRLKSARAALDLRREPRADAALEATFPAGTLVRVVETSRRGDAWIEVERFSGLPAYGGPSPEVASARGFARADELGDGDDAVGVRALDDRTLDVELERPAPYFLDLTSSPNFAPVRRDVIEPFERRGERDRWTRPENIVTNGPYTLESWRLRYAVTAKPNPFHRDRDKLAIRRIVWLGVESGYTAMNLYQAGQLDLYGNNISYPAEYTAILERKRDHRRYATLATYWYSLNVKRPPLDDPRVRHALDLAIDKRLLTDTIARGGLPATHYVPEVTGFGYAAEHAREREAGRDPFSGPGHDFDPARARSLLRESGYPVEVSAGGARAQGFPAVEILYPSGGDGHRKIAVAIQDMWRKNLGVEVALRALEWKVFLDERRDGRFQIVSTAWTLDYNHPQAVLDTFAAGNGDNETAWADPAFHEALRAAASAIDPGESVRAYRRAERIAVEGMARLPLYFFTTSTLVKPYVRGIFDNARNIQPLHYAWIDPDWARGGPDRPAFAPLEFPPPGRVGATP